LKSRLVSPVKYYDKETGKMVLDVVCNMEIDEKTAKWKSEYKEKTYYFCSPMCKQKFDRSPEKYVK